MSDHASAVDELALLLSWAPPRVPVVVGGPPELEPALRATAEALGFGWVGGLPVEQVCAQLYALETGRQCAAQVFWLAGDAYRQLTLRDPNTLQRCTRLQIDS